MAQMEDPEEAREEARDVGWALRYAQHKLTGKCWAIETDFGPHPGCAEFTPGVSYPCSEEGTQWVLMWDYEFGPPTPDWELMCTHHAQEMREETENRLVTAQRVS